MQKPYYLFAYIYGKNKSCKIHFVTTLEQNLWAILLFIMILLHEIASCKPLSQDKNRSGRTLTKKD